MARGRRSHWTRVAKEFQRRFSLSWKDAVEAYRAFRDALARRGEKPSINAVRRHRRLAREAAKVGRKREVRVRWEKRTAGAVSEVRGEPVFTGYPRAGRWQQAYRYLDAYDFWASVSKLRVVEDEERAYRAALEALIPRVEQLSATLLNVQETLAELGVPVAQQVELAMIVGACWLVRTREGRVPSELRSMLREAMERLGLEVGFYMGFLRSLGERLT